MTDSMKRAIVRWTPWWVFRILIALRLVRRSTVFRWEINLALGEWK